MSSTSNLERSLWDKIASASIGALVTSLIVTPFDVIKVRLQTQHVPSISQYIQRGLSEENLVYCNKLFDHVEPMFFRAKSNFPIASECKSHLSGGTLDAIRVILVNEGVSSLYRGLFPTLIMSIPATVVYFIGYETLRDNITFFSTLPPSIQDIASPLFCGSLARTLAASVISPLELIRTQMQSISHYRQSLSSITKDIKSMVRKEGILALWKGLTPTLWRDVPFSALYWLGYEKIKKELTLLTANSSSHLSNDFLVSFSSGCISGMIAAFLTTPFDVAKTKRQTQGMLHSHSELPSYRHETSLFRILCSLWKEERWRGLFKGLTPRLVKVAPACGIMISSYEVGKGFFGIEHER